jgi:DNA-directed RNA polymerase subunit H (RpoH/RPB5)
MERATQILTEMVSQREYKISEQDEKKIIAFNKKGKCVVVFLEPVSKFSVDRFKEYIGKMEVLNDKLEKRIYKHGIIVYTDTITPMGKKMITESDCIKFELFFIDELQYNITSHRLVPRHIKLKDKEAKEFKNKFGLKHPCILKSDPISKFYNYNRGDVIKIMRPSGFITYRIVKG